MAGFGHTTGIDLPHEADGVVPSPEWKLRNSAQKWYAGETISVAIGQGALTVTPLQLARAIGGHRDGRRLVSAAPGESQTRPRSPHQLDAQSGERAKTWSTACTAW